MITFNNLFESIKILIGIDNNKERIISYDEGNKFDKKINIPFFEINVHNKNFINELFYKLIELYFEKHNIIYNNNINYIAKVFVSCSLNNCSNDKEILMFINTKLYNIRLKNIKNILFPF